MRERVAALGGALHTGPGADGGFTVRAHLPLHDARREPAEAPAELPARRAGSSAAVA
jgi:signal transduction histidine kinase